MEEKIRATGKTFEGQELDGLLYPKAERVIIATHKGPMLGKFQTGCPKVEVRYGLKRKSGEGKNNLAGRRGTELNWYKKGGGTLYIDPTSGRGSPDEVGWTNLGVDFLKRAGLAELDQVSLDGVLDGLSVGEDHTLLFVKGILYLRTISVSYSVEGTKISAAADLPNVKTGNMKDKVGQVGHRSCTIDVDRLDEKECTVALLSSMEYPALVSTLDGVPCIYSRMSLPACSMMFVGREEGTVTKKKEVPTPVRWWKALIGLACKLGAVGDLIRAFRATRGLASWLDGLDTLGVRDFRMTMDIIPTKGCRSVLTDSNLARTDVVKQPTNMVASLGELVCDWGAGLEMRNMLVHVSDEFGLGNKELNRNVANLDECSIGDSLLREAGFFDFGRRNRFYLEMRDRMQSEVAFLGDKDIKGLIKLVGELMMRYASSGDTATSDLLLEFKNVSFTAYFGQVWNVNSTCMVGEDATITNQTLGAATTKKNSWVYNLKCWLDVYGLSGKVSILCGYNAIQKVALDAISFETMGLIDGAEGVYVEVHREVNWRDKYKTRVGSETLEKDRFGFVKTLEEEDTEDAVEGSQEPDWIVWEPPADGWIKANTDASCIEFDEDGKGMISIGGVFRDSNGRWIRGFMGTMGRGSIMQSELMAIKEAVLIAKDYGVNALRVESDSLDAVRAIAVKSRDEEVRALIDDINVLISSGMEVKISYQPREGNRVADQMARNGRNKPVVGVERVQDPPENVLSILAEDMRGLHLQRF